MSFEPPRLSWFSTTSGLKDTGRKKTLTGSALGSQMRRLPPLDPAARESVRRFKSLSAIRPMALRRYGLDIVVASIKADSPHIAECVARSAEPRNDLPRSSENFTGGGNHVS